MVHPTIRTLPLPDTQRHFLNNMPAVFASFRAGKPAVNFYQFPTVPLAFIGKLSGQFTPTSVRNSLCQFAVQDHIFDSQILNYYRLVFAHQLSCQLVQKIFASIGYLPVYFGCFQSRLVPVVASFLFPRQGFLPPPQLLVQPLKVFGVRNLLAVSGSNQTGDPNSKPTALLVLSCGLTVGSSTSKETNHRPCASSLTVMVDGLHPGGICLLHLIGKGSEHLPRNT